MQCSFLKVVSIATLLISSFTCNAADIWIDVRSAEEFQAGHLPEASNIPHTDIVARIKEVSKDKNDTIHLYCRSGRRSDQAMEALKKQGFTQVVNEGGYEDLVKKRSAK
ncbi:MAG: Thiosulfate sulfurtransferase PspE precursor [Pseudomonadota bacterium]|jgi:phage shock protein E